MGYRIEVRDAALSRVGIIDTWMQLDLVARYCQQGTWSLVIADDHPQAKLLQPGGGIAVFQDGVETPVLTGPADSFQRSWTTGGQGGYGTLTVSGKCDNRLAYTRLAYPDPAQAADQQWNTTDDTRAVSGPAGTLTWTELARALGPEARADRQTAGVAFPATAVTGNAVADNLQWDVIGTKLESWTTPDTNVGYRFVYDPDTRQINFLVSECRDLSASVRFSTELGNLQQFTWTLSAPSVTRVIVACQGSGKYRYMHQETDADAEAEWGLSVEQFVDRRDLPIMWDPVTRKAVKASLDVSDADFATAVQAAQQAATDALTAGAGTGTIQITPIDTPHLTFGRDYQLGDKITVSQGGTDYTDIVTEVTISVSDGGNTSTVTPSVGKSGGTQPNIYRTVNQMRTQLRKLEARL